MDINAMYLPSRYRFCCPSIFMLFRFYLMPFSLPEHFLQKVLQGESDFLCLRLVLCLFERCYQRRG